ncbi:nuclear transport factor 2 family protein [Pelagibacterium sp. H642]|uniref:nuclear transport factor 2 family protein n=1 Tax=Pelagibacterium sp. H642 TaxID=1881069 RepID=UPI002815CFEF|nr:nuclear transport factor 2 family protein [Pelagibacterium sp. H642]WMT89659.1 nuclear transport factor 2 family protein [Pelagibacterium sp. H642]
MKRAKSDFDAFFQSYVRAYNRSLGESVDVHGIRSHFSESFIAAGPGTVMTGDNDETFTETLQKGYAFYKSIGTRRMEVTSVEVTDIDEEHYLAKVGYQAQYEKDGEAIAIPFCVSYLLEERDGRLKVFGFVAGDEMELYRQHGLIER